jgi:hypothetical protein
LAYAEADNRSAHQIRSAGRSRAELKGTDEYDRTGVAKWAMDHWNDNSDDPFDNNCTNFASNALEGGGLRQHADFWLGNLSDESWSKGAQTGWGWFDEDGYSHSASWAQAPTSYEFWTKHGREVRVADARPGDIVYWEQEEGGYDIPPGTVHHAAVVTSVVDGDVRYTQHSGNQLNASLDGRGPVNALGGGRQKIHIVRPDPDSGSATGPARRSCPGCRGSSCRWALPAPSSWHCRQRRLCWPTAGWVPHPGGGRPPDCWQSRLWPERCSPPGSAWWQSLPSLRVRRTAAGDAGARLQPSPVAREAGGGGSAPLIGGTPPPVCGGAARPAHCRRGPRSTPCSEVSFRGAPR